MRKIIALSFVFAVFSACSSDDSPSQAASDYNQLILGKWYPLGSTENNGPFNSYTHDCPESRDYEEFKSNGVGTFVGHNAECEVDEEESGNYVIEGNLLQITDTGEFPLNSEFTITTLNETEMVLTQTVNEPGGQVVVVAKYTKI